MKKTLDFKRIFSIFTVFSLILCTFTSCGKDIPMGSGESILYPLAASPKNLDPQTAVDESSVIIIRNIFEGLTRVGTDGKLAAGVATSWQSNENNTQWTFTLRHDAQWFDGQKITADDFVFAWQRAVKSESNSKNSYMFYCIKNAKNIRENNEDVRTLGVQATDTHTLTVTLEYPFADFAQLVSQTPFMPCNEDFFNSTNGKYGISPTNILSNGPFYLKVKNSWVDGEYVRISCNENYIGSSYAIAKTVFMGVQNEGTDFSGLLNGGTADAVKSANADFTKISSSASGFSDTTWGIVFNTSSSPFSNVEVRLAFAKSIDLNSLTEAFPDKATPAAGIIPPAVSFEGNSYRDLVDLQVNLYAPDQVQAHISSAVVYLDKNQLPEITLLCPDNEKLKYLAQLIIADWQENMYATVNLEVLTQSEIENNIKSGDFQIAISPITSKYNSAVGFLSSFRSDSGNNLSHYASNTFDELLDNVSLGDDTLYLSNAATAEKYLLENALFYPLFNQYEYTAVSSKVEGIKILPFDGSIDFSKAIKEED